MPVQIASDNDEDSLEAVTDSLLTAYDVNWDGYIDFAEFMFKLKLEDGQTSLVL